MKTSIVSFGITLILTLCPAAFTAGIYENANQSAEFIRTLTRYASTETDSVFYNPAGSVFMNEGLYLYFSDQMIFDYTTMTDSSPILSGYSYPSEYEADIRAWAFPDIYLLYRQGKWSAFLNLGIIGRGAVAAYDTSTPTIDKTIIYYADFVTGNTLDGISTDGSLEAYSFFIGTTLGGAYRLNSILSIGGGIRYVHAEQNTHLKYRFNSVHSSSLGDMIVFAPAAFSDIDVDVNARGHSAGLIGGFDVKPSDTMNIGFRYEYYTPMKVKNEKPDKYESPVNFLPFLARFKMNKDDYVKATLPMNTAMGISYTAMPQLKAEAGFIYYFNRLADWGKDAAGNDIAEKYDNGYDASLSLEYRFIKQFRGSIGYSHSVSGVNSKTRTNDMTGLDANAYAAGGTWTFLNGLDLTVAMLLVFFEDAAETNNLIPGDTGRINYEDQVYNFSAGINYKIM